METHPVLAAHSLVARRLLRVAIGLTAALWMVAPGPPAAVAGTAAPRPAVAADQEALRALFGSENRVIRTREPVVAVTFNAAWNDAGLHRVLGDLACQHAPATFFLTGDFAHRYPGAVRRIVTAGHGLGNHSYSHPYFKDLTAAGRRREVLAADRALRAAGAGEALTPFFRFPYSETNFAQIREVNGLGFADIEFTTDTNGWQGTEGGMTVDRAVRRALQALRPGAVLQMHVGASEGRTEVIDAEALPRILDAITARGYRVIDLRTLLTSPSAPGEVIDTARRTGRGRYAAVTRSATMPSTSSSDNYFDLQGRTERLEDVQEHCAPLQVRAAPKAPARGGRTVEIAERGIRGGVAAEPVEPRSVRPVLDHHTPRIRAQSWS
ncbi:polysaccharide deacetylase family protein [Streptomyces sp. NPDC046939]|uniref:polysaccharide deacetylase family protein n=1 Tax=Streptomyces sp. NPDC046939 TaxID=3155376 RepID=UPI0033C36FA8